MGGGGWGVGGWGGGGGGCSLPEILREFNQQNFPVSTREEGALALGKEQNGGGGLGFT